MGLFNNFGAKISGLLGDGAFLDHLAQAQAFANGDPEAAARIGVGIRRRRRAGESSMESTAPSGWHDPSAFWEMPEARFQLLRRGVVPPQSGFDAQRRRFI